MAKATAEFHTTITSRFRTSLFSALLQRYLLMDPTVLSNDFSIAIPQCEARETHIEVGLRRGDRTLSYTCHTIQIICAVHVGLSMLVNVYVCGLHKLRSLGMVLDVVSGMLAEVAVDIVQREEP